jgi:hypothetical protein
LRISAGKTIANHDRRIGAPEVAHVGVQGLSAGDGQHDASECREGDAAVLEEELGAVGRRHCAQDPRVVGDPVHAGDRQDHEPHGHDRAEEAPDRAGAEALDGEQHGDDRHRDRHDE